MKKSIATIVAVLTLFTANIIQAKSIKTETTSIEISCSNNERSLLLGLWIRELNASGR